MLLVIVSENKLTSLCQSKLKPNCSSKGVAILYDNDGPSCNEGYVEKTENPSRTQASVLLDLDDQESPHIYQSLPIQCLEP